MGSQVHCFRGIIYSGIMPTMEREFYLEATAHTRYTGIIASTNGSPSVAYTSQSQSSRV